MLLSRNAVRFFHLVSKVQYWQLIDIPKPIYISSYRFYKDINPSPNLYPVTSWTWGMAGPLGLVWRPWGRSRSPGPRVAAVGTWPFPWASCGRRGGVAGPLGLVWLPWGRGRSPGPRVAAVVIGTGEVYNVKLELCTILGMKREELNSLLPNPG